VLFEKYTLAAIFSVWIRYFFAEELMTDKLGNVQAASLSFKGADLTYVAGKTFVGLFLLLPSGIQLQVVVLINPQKVVGAILSYRCHIIYMATLSNTYNNNTKSFLFV